jgi:hypothetical protein
MWVTGAHRETSERRRTASRSSAGSKLSGVAAVMPGRRRRTLVTAWCSTGRHNGHERVEPKQKMETGNYFWAFAAFYRVTEGLTPVGDEGDRRPMVSGTSMLGAATSGEGR